MPNLIHMNRQAALLRRIRWLTWLFIFGLFVSGATAIPLAGELNLLVNWFGADGTTSGLASWLLRVRNRWLFDFGLIACVLVIPYALVFGGLRGIPIWWRLIDCSFGVIGFIPLWFCRKWGIQLERQKG